MTSMVATKGSSSPDLDALLAWQAALTTQLEDLRNEIRLKQVALVQVEERLNLVTRLIDMETRTQGDNPAKSDDTELAIPASPSSVAHDGSSDLVTAVEKILRNAGEPLHISAIREALIKNGVPIPGRGDEANIIVRLRRLNGRFTRTARGTYGLAEWGMPELKAKRRRSGAR